MAARLPAICATVTASMFLFMLAHPLVVVAFVVLLAITASLLVWAALGELDDDEPVNDVDVVRAERGNAA